MEILFGLIAGVAIAFAVFNKTIQIRITHKHEYDAPAPIAEKEAVDNSEALADAEKYLKESTAAYNEVMNMFSGIEVSDHE